MKKRNKKGFAIIYAVMLMILIATVGMHTIFMINNTQSATIKEHIKIQMELYMSSSIEYTLLFMSENKITSDKTITIKYPGNYEFTVNIKPLNIPVDIPESQGTALLDLRGEYKDNQHNFILTKRTIQKP